MLFYNCCFYYKAMDAMRQTIFLLFLILFYPIIICASDEPKGYTIVLASFSKFDEAKRELSILGAKMGQEESLLQKKYNFEMLVRPSGKGFVVAIEPLKDKKSVEAVREYFKIWYPDTYTGNYIDPVVWQFQEVAMQKEVKSTVDKNGETPRLKETRLSTEEGYPWGWICGFAFVSSVFALGSFLFLRRKTTIEKYGAMECLQESAFVGYGASRVDNNEERTLCDTDVSDGTMQLEILRQSLEKSLFIDTATVKIFAEPTDEDTAVLMQQLKRHIDKLEYEQALEVLQSILGVSNER
jgi:hypothetical protein